MLFEIFHPQTITVGCAFLAVTIAIYCAFQYVNPYWVRVHWRVNDMARDRQHSGAPTNALGGPLKFMRGSLIATKLAELLQKSDRANFRKRLEMAGFQNPVIYSRLVVLRWVLMILPPIASLAAGLAGYVSIEVSMLFAYVLAGLGYLLPGVWLNRAVSRYRGMLGSAMPDFLDLVIVCLDAGLSLQESIKRVGEELQMLYPAFSSELDVVQRDIELGSSVDRALRRFATRTDYDAVRTLSTLIREGQKFGTNISDALRGHSETLRLNREHAAEEYAQKASVKIILPTLFFIFPAIFVVLVSPAAFQIQEAFSR
ncbi:type II secretion system F family protein [Neorhodopirellula lusitana]|uniref:type II secretion system F family protein n=1 Tax=Neorhodopirellula lusitana TaxID=445327 RepID=UPI00384B352D